MAPCAPAPKLADLSPKMLSERKTVPRADGWPFEFKYKCVPQSVVFPTAAATRWPLRLATRGVAIVRTR